MENAVKIIGDNTEAPIGVEVEKNNFSLSSDEEHLKPENGSLSENSNSNKANLGSDSPLTETLSTGLSILRSQSLQSIASSTVGLMDNRSRSYVDFHCIDDGAVDFSVKQHGSDSEGKVSSGHRSGSSGKNSPEYRSGSSGKNSPEYRSGLYGRGSPEHGLGLYGGSSPEHVAGSNGIVSHEHCSSFYEERYPENDSHSYGMHSPEHGSDSDGRISPKPAMDECINENSQIYNVNSTEKLDREIIEDEEDDNIKRIKNWINQIDLSANMVVEELGESSESGSVTGPIPDRMSSVQVARGPSDPKASVGMAMAYNYISAMNPVTASAQLCNLGLVAVPILSAFAGLRELSLSGNNIFQITAGAIPKGLHTLNLSKNYISAIEGFKDLTKLRIIDLSHNRISRIGHGLSACSSLRELYLAANKISEVEGLHRLLKLKILDLRNNKLSTAKGLEQLAANYTSLEAISLDGNPAQRLVGDDHLKKYLRTLLPNLVYYNRQSAKSRGKKDAIAMPSSHNSPRRFAGASGPSLRSRTSSRGGTNHLLKSSRSRNVQLPSSSSRFGVTGLNPMRRIQSEGAMGD